MIQAFISDYGVAVVLFTMMTISIVGMVAQIEYSKYMKAEYDDDLPRMSINNRMEAFVIELRILFSKERRAPFQFKVVVFIFRVLWILFLMELVALFFTRGR